MNDLRDVHNQINLVLGDRQVTLATTYKAINNLYPKSHIWVSS